MSTSAHTVGLARPRWKRHHPRDHVDVLELGEAALEQVGSGRQSASVNDEDLGPAMLHGAVAGA